jgi:hypothetical protein
MLVGQYLNFLHQQFVLAAPWGKDNCKQGAPPETAGDPPSTGAP